MKGDPNIIKLLNDQLTNELTAINQYFLHARMYKHWGFEKLGKHEYDESIGEMKHADWLIERVFQQQPGDRRLDPQRAVQRRQRRGSTRRRILPSSLPRSARRTPQAGR